MRAGPLIRHRRIGGDAASQAGWTDDLPAIFLAPYLDDRYAVGGLRFRHFFGAPVLHAAAVQQAVVGVFVVDAKQAVGGRWLAVLNEGEEVHAVVVHSGLLPLGGRIVAGIGAGVRPVGNRVAPGVEQTGRVAVGQHDGIGGGCRDAGEAVDCPAGATGAGGQVGKRYACGGQGTTAHGQYGSRKEAAAERVRQHVECGVMVGFVGVWIKTGIGHGSSR